MKRRAGDVTRRDLAIALAIPAVALAQQPAAPVEDLEAAAREQVKRSAETLRKFQVAVATEPSFSFRP